MQHILQNKKFKLIVMLLSRVGIDTAQGRSKLYHY